MTLDDAYLDPENCNPPISAIPIGMIHCFFPHGFFTGIATGFTTGVVTAPAAPPVAWTASSGRITTEGVYTARTTCGLHNIRVTAGDREAIAEVRVRTDQPQSNEKEDDRSEQKPGMQILRWRGTVPPQKWMNFYTKVLTRLASSPELKLEVSIEIPVDEKQAQIKADETRFGLKELGLNDNASLT